MQILRNAHLIARFVLVWFALSIGVAIASPMVNPQAMQLVCSGTGSVKVVVNNDDGKTAPASHTLDCPLCAGLGSVPPFEALAFGMAAPRAYALPVHEGEHFTFISTAPPPARGPPSPI